MDRIRGLGRFIALAMLVLLALSARDAYAETCPAEIYSPPGGGSYADEGLAYAACMAAGSAGNLKNITSYIRTFDGCVMTIPGRYQPKFTVVKAVTNCSTAAAGNSTYFGTYFYATTCSSRSDYTGSPPYSTQSGFPVQGSISCKDGCATAWYNNGDGTWSGDSMSTVCSDEQLKTDCSALGEGYVWNAYAGLCQAPKQKCESNQTQDAVTGECKDQCPAGMSMDASGACVAQEDDCPAGNVKSPAGECLPGEGQCAAGEAKRDNGTCGKDADGDGVADDDDDNPDNDTDKPEASGGDSCDSPPSCSGDAIACMQVKIQWRIDCNTRKKANVSGGTCGSVPVCTGDGCSAMEYAKLVQQWKAACSLEKLLAKDSGTGDGSQPAWTRVDGMSQDPGAGETADDAPTLHTKTVDVEDLDQSGFGGGGGACPAIAAAGGGQLSSGFLSVLASPPPIFCNFVGMMKAIIILCAAVTSAYILARGGR